MAKPHKYANATVDIQTQLSNAEVQNIIRQIVDSMKEVQIDQSDSEVIHLSVKSWAKVTQMNFAIVCSATGGGTRASTHIIDYLTTQDKILAFIPVGPLTMLGWKPYKRFMETFAASISAVDHSAQTSIVEIAVEA